MIDPDAYQCAFDALPPRTRQVFLLHRMDDLSYAEIAERLGISIEAVQEEMTNALRDICRMVTNSAANDRCAAPADVIRMKHAHRRWRFWWRLRHWRSWFLRPVDHDDVQAHADYVLRCLPREQLPRGRHHG